MVVTLEEVRARGIVLPADDDAAQDIIDGEEAWLARRIGPLTGARTETFYVGLSRTHGKLGLARFTDEVDVEDGGSAVDSDHLRLIDRGAAIVRSYASPTRYWTGPYVAVTSTPTDEAEVRRVLFDLIALAAQPAKPYESEQIGAYSYRRGGASAITASRAILADSILPRRDPTLTLYARATA